MGSCARKLFNCSNCSFGAAFPFPIRAVCAENRPKSISDIWQRRG